MLSHEERGPSKLRLCPFRLKRALSRPERALRRSGGPFSCQHRNIPSQQKDLLGRKRARFCLKRTLSGQQRAIPDRQMPARSTQGGQGAPVGRNRAFDGLKRPFSRQHGDLSSQHRDLLGQKRATLDQKGPFKPTKGHHSLTNGLPDQHNSLSG